MHAFAGVLSPMADKPVCLVCKKEMEKGFMTDRAAGGIDIPRWCPGEPKQPGLAGGEVMDTQVITRGIKVVAYRCPECEALRLYAPSSGKKK